MKSLACLSLGRVGLCSGMVIWGDFLSGRFDLVNVVLQAYTGELLENSYKIEKSSSFEKSLTLKKSHILKSRLIENSHIDTVKNK